jgi:2-aminoadipate transaminase
VQVPVPELDDALPQRPFLKPGCPNDPIIHLSGPWIDPDFLPCERIASYFRSVLNQLSLATFYSEAGYKPLREALAKRPRGIDTDPNHIVITAGSQQGYDLVCRIVKEQRVTIESPAYGLARSLFDLNRMKPVRLPIDSFEGIDLKLWEKTIRAHRPSLVSMTTSFQNPTGYFYSTEEITVLLKMSETFGLGIIEDDWGSDTMSFSEFRPSVQALGGDGLFYLNTFTKKLLPSLRVEYIVGCEKTTPLLLQS